MSGAASAGRMKLHAIVTALALLAGAAHAQRMQDTGDAARDEARAFYTEGVTHMKRKEYASAHKAFAKANALYEASTIKLQYALCLEKEGKVDDAKAMLRELVAHPPQLGDSQPLKDAYGQGIRELARLEAQSLPPARPLPTPVLPQPGPMPPPPPPAPTPEVPAQPAYDPNARPVAPAPKAPMSPAPPATPLAPIEPIRGVMASGAKARAPDPSMVAAEKKSERSATSPTAHTAGLLLGADLGGATGDTRADQEGVFGLHGGVYVLRNVYAGGRIGWYGSVNKSARSSSQHFEFGFRTDDNGAGISIVGLLGARKVETWRVLSNTSNAVSSSTQTEIGLVAGKRFVLGQAFYLAPEVGLMHSLAETGTGGTPQFVNGSLQYVGGTTDTPAATRIYLGIAGEFHIGL